MRRTVASDQVAFWISELGWKLHFRAQRLEGDEPDSGYDDAFEAGYRAGHRAAGKPLPPRPVERHLRAV